jgi:hypothetical protein
MSRIRWTMIAVSMALLSVVGLVVFNRSLDAQEKKPAADKKPAPAAANNAFAGKVLLVQRRNDSSPSVIRSMNIDMGVFGYVLENASVTDVAGVRMLTGHGIERDDGKPAGPRVCIPVDGIGAILEFENVDAFIQFEEQQSERIRGNAIQMMMPAPAVQFDLGQPAEGAPDE